MTVERWTFLNLGSRTAALDCRLTRARVGALHLRPMLKPLAERGREAASLQQPTAAFHPANAPSLGPDLPRFLLLPTGTTEVSFVRQKLDVLGRAEVPYGAHQTQ
jgi:hypothetical protein